MSSRKKRILIFAATIVLLVAALFFVGRSMLRSFFYPRPSSLPPVVTQSTEELLTELEATLKEHAPLVAQSLQPGLSNEQIAALEQRGGFQLSDDLRALYRWRNGVAPGKRVELIPGHQFLPLEDVLSQQAARHEQFRSATVIQKVVYSLVAGHRDQWVPIFPDLAGDGYFYDPNRADREGAFFFHFAEMGHYHWFPSFRNFLAGAVECFENGHFRPNEGREGEGLLQQDYEKAQAIWQRLGKPKEMD